MKAEPTDDDELAARAAQMLADKIKAAEAAYVTEHRTPSAATARTSYEQEGAWAHSALALTAAQRRNGPPRARPSHSSLSM